MGEEIKNGEKVSYEYWKEYGDKYGYLRKAENELLELVQEMIPDKVESLGLGRGWNKCREQIIENFETLWQRGASK